MEHVWLLGGCASGKASFVAAAATSGDKFRKDHGLLGSLCALLPPRLGKPNVLSPEEIAAVISDHVLIKWQWADMDTGLVEAVRALCPEADQRFLVFTLDHQERRRRFRKRSPESEVTDLALANEESNIREYVRGLTRAGSHVRVLNSTDAPVFEPVDVESFLANAE